jgi:hypothetical protein
MLELSPDCLDLWKKDFDKFRVEFLEYCHPVTKAGGYYLTFAQSLLSTAHSGWVAECEKWDAGYIMPDSDGLSHLKTLAILLHSLASVEWVTQFEVFDPADERDGHTFEGEKEDYDEFCAALNAGRGTYLAFQFCILIVNWYESARTDRAQEFELRLTHDLEHDFMVYLLSERREPMAIFLFLKALYVRDAI